MPNTAETLTFAALAYSGSLVPGYTATPKLPHPYVMDLNGAKVARQPQVNFAHRPQAPIGRVTSHAIDRRRVWMRGELTDETPHAAEVVVSAAAGMPWEVSIEGSLRDREFVPEGDRETVNNQTFEGPFYIFRRPTFTALALVAVGADDGNALKLGA